MKDKKYITNKIQEDVEDFWKWALKSYSEEQINNGRIDSLSFPNWNQVEKNLEQAFKELDFEYLRDKDLDNIIFLIAQQWDMGIILNWFNKGAEEIGQIGMTKKQLQILCERGLNSKLPDAKSQFAASLYKIENRKIAIDLLVKYYKDENEYVSRCSLQSLHKLNYEKINPLLLNTWKENDEQGRMSCLQIWSEINEELFERYSNAAEKDEREYLSEYSKRLIKEKDTAANKT